MSMTQTKRMSAIKVADTLNMIEGAPVSNFAKEISTKWKNYRLAEAELSRANM